jgi:hypothetical protein
MADVAGATLEAIARYAPVIDVPPPAVLDQARRNIEAQVALLQEFGGETAERLAARVGSKARRAGSMVENWRRAHRVVTVRWHDDQFVPGFLLRADFQPNPDARAALTVLHEQGFSDWQAALWWTLPAPALEGRRPVDVLLDESAGRANSAAVGERLAVAARRRRDWF